MSHDLLVQMAYSPFFYVRMKSTSLFLVTKLRVNRYCEGQLMWRFYKKGKNGRNRLRLMSVFNVYNHVYRETFFFPLGNLSLDPGGKKTRIVSVFLRRTHSLCRYQCYARGGGGGGLRDRVGTQREPNRNYFPIGRYGKRSSVAAPI